MSLPVNLKFIALYLKFSINRALRGGDSPLLKNQLLFWALPPGMCETAYVKA